MIRLALPTGDLRKPLAAALASAGIDIPGYGEGSRSYRFQAGTSDEVAIRVFRERDIPVQIALGNYDVGICGAADVEDYLWRFPQGSVTRVGELGVGRRTLYAAAAAHAPSQTVAPPAGGRAPLRIASEYGNIAEAFAIGLRLPAYRVLPVWGSAHAYPPEDADVAIVSASGPDVLAGWGLRPLATLLEGGAALIANRDGIATKDLSPLLTPLTSALRSVGESGLRLPRRVEGLPAPRGRPDVVRLAVPDGHQQPDAVAALQDAGIELDGYDLSRADIRPSSGVDGLEVKVIRPQDMAQQVALGSFDLAITGRDWLFDHKIRFPSSPARQLVDLGRCRYTLVATMSEDESASSLGEALRQWRSGGRQTIRVASEYMAIADHYAQGWRLGRYQVIPIAGASEGFVPEDAEILIEGTETGSTLAANRLKIVERLFESTSRVIGHAEVPRGQRGELVEKLITQFQRAAVPAGAGGR